MKELEQKAQNLINKFIPFSDTQNLGQEGEVLNATQCAIQSVNHTIETLEKVLQEEKNLYGGNRIISEHLYEQIELKKILEGRL